MENRRALRPDDDFRAASVTKSVTAAVAVGLAHQGRLALDEPLADQLAPGLLARWRALDALPRTTPRQLLAHTSGLPNYFTDEAFAVRLREDPGRAWAGRAGGPCGRIRNATLSSRPGLRVLRHRLRGRRDPRGAGHRPAAPRGLPRARLRPGRDEQRPGWKATSLRGRRKQHTTTRASSIGRPSPRRSTGPAAASSPPRPTSTRFVHALWSEQILGSRALDELTRWTPEAWFPPGHALRYERYGLGMGTNTVEGVELLGPHRLHRSLRLPRSRLRRGAGRHRITPRRSIAGRWWPRSAGSCARRPDQNRR